MHSLLYIADRISKKNSDMTVNFAFLLLKKPYTSVDKFVFFDNKIVVSTV